MEGQFVSTFYYLKLDANKTSVEGLYNDDGNDIWLLEAPCSHMH